MDETSAPNGSARGRDLEDGIHARAEAQLQVARDALDDLDRRARRLVRERPVACLLGAVALGFLVGRIAARR